MKYIDVCNGDADGLCAVVQWRLHDPQMSELITGLKRDIGLLERVRAGRGDEVLVCDLSMRRNLASLTHLLEAGVFVRYFDHHKVDKIPAHTLLQAHIDIASTTCTSLLVDACLGGRFRTWAIVGAYGDNLTNVAQGLALDLGLSGEDRRRLQSLGESINYNAYGNSDADVHMAPAKLYDLLARYPDPLTFLDSEDIGSALEAWRQSDLRQAETLPPYVETAHVRVYLLPDAPWSRRVSGSFNNLLASARPRQAHALLTVAAGGDFVVSLRAPVCAPVGAAEFCRGFGGDGRAGAAGIDHLPASRLDEFIKSFTAAPWHNVPGL